MIARYLRTSTRAFPFPTCHERSRWQPLAATALGRDLLARADQALAEPTPALSAGAYLAFQRSGAREPYEIPHIARRTRLMLFALAECLEGAGRFTAATLDEAWAICEESSWVVPAHAAAYPQHLPDPSLPLIDLFSAITAATMAEVDYLLGDILHPALRTRIRAEVDRRSTAAFLAHNEYPWLGYGVKPINNWLPVCAGGTTIAALYLEEDVDRLAAVLAKTLDGIERYIATFHDDGGTPEGLGYWEKGIFFVAALGELLATRTAGQIDLLAHPRLARIARFPARVELSPGQFVPFSDTGLRRQPQMALLHYLARRYDLPELAALDRTPSSARRLTNRGPAEKLRDLFWYPADSEPAPAPLPAPAADFLPDIQWFIARADPADPDGLVLVAKGGHNAEPHNQNDVGSFVVHWRGETLLADLGAMRYTRETFQAATRYTLLANRSLGHNVPLVNDAEQRPGPYAAQQVRREAGATSDSFCLDLAQVYQEQADLAVLERRIMLHRDEPDGVVELRDHAVFATRPGYFASVLISLVPVDLVAPGFCMFIGRQGRLRVEYAADEVEALLETIPQVDLREGPRDVTRVHFRARHPAQNITVRLVMRPDRALA
ncbi:MAG: heparinase [Blastochloris sp.]|nr:heparinase [Blastochloris sp.]